MRSAVNWRWSFGGWRKPVFYGLLLAVVCLPACRAPVLEEPECLQARDAVKRFYSFHFGNDMRFSPENLDQRREFLTAEYYDSLRNHQAEADVFTTNSTDHPKAFRAGKCEVVSPEKTRFEVLLFWKDDTQNQQKAIDVEVIKQNDKWLINKVHQNS